MTDEKEDFTSSITPASESQKTKEQWIEEAKAYQKAGDFQEAIAAFDQAIRLDPDNPQNYKEKGNLLYDLQHYEQALHTFEQVLRLDPGDTNASKKKIDIQILFGQYNPSHREQAEAERETIEWVMVNTPDAQEICERIWAFSLPVDTQILLLSIDALFTIDLKTPEDAKRDDSSAGWNEWYDEKNHLFTYNKRQFQLLGVAGGTPLLQNQYGERILFSPQKLLKGQQSRRQTFQVQGRIGDIRLAFEFEDPSGDWAYVSFSSDSNYIVVGSPYTFSVFQRIDRAS